MRRWIFEDTSDNYLKYLEDNREEIIADYKNRVMSQVTGKTRKVFDKISKLLNDDSEGYSNVDYFYFTKVAVDFIESKMQRYHLNSHMDLKVSDILSDIEEHNSIEEVIDSYFEDYDESYAFSWADNFVNTLNSL